MMSEDELIKNFIPLEYLEEELRKTKDGKPISPDAQYFRDMRIEILEELIEGWREGDREEKIGWLLKQLSSQ